MVIFHKRLKRAMLASLPHKEEVSYGGIRGTSPKRGCSNIPVITTNYAGQKGPYTFIVQMGKLRLGDSSVPKVSETQL